MEIDNETDPSQIKSFLDKSLDIADSNKKRKLEADQSSLPISKHQCWKQSLSSKHPTFDTIPEADGLSSPCTFKVNRGNVYDVSETGSGKDSNSYAEDSDSAMSMHADAKCLLYNIASSSLLDSGSSSQGSRYSSDGTTVASSSVEKEVLSSPGVEPAELADNLKDTLVEYGSDIDYLYSGYGNYTIEEYQDKEIEEIISSDEANPNVYVLSSGRWSVNQEAQQTKRKPTIDQEFEQYFSMLML